MIRLQPFWTREALVAQREASRQLATGRGFDGRALAGKRQANGKPLGQGDTPTGLVGALLQGSVAADDAGFRVTYTSDALVHFHRGTSRQPARPVIGVAPALRRAMVRRATREVARQISARMRGGR